MELYRNPTKICSRIAIAILVLMVVWVAGALILTLLTFFLAPSFAQNPWFLWIVNDVPLYCIALPVYLAILGTIPDGRETRPPPVGINLWKFLVLAVFCIGATYLVSMLTDAFQDLVTFWKPAVMEDMVDSLLDQSGPLQNFLFVACVPALGEEFIFRYTLRKKLREAGDKIYIFFSALCFAMFHANFSQIFFAFVVGIIFAWLYLQTDNIWLPIGLHFCINFLSILVPGITATSVGETAFYAVMAVPIILAVVLFLVFLRQVRAGLRPPSEPGWPYKPPKNDLKASWVCQTTALKDPPAADPARTSVLHPPWQGTPQPAVFYPGHHPGGYPVPAAYPPPPCAYPPRQPYPWPQAQPSRPFQNTWPPQNMQPQAYPVYTNGYMGPKYIPEYHGKPKGAVALCLGNVWMILFLVVTGLISLFTLMIL